MTFALLRRACVLPVPQRLTISLRVALLKISTFEQTRGEERKICKSGNKKEKTMASGVL